MAVKGLFAAAAVLAITLAMLLPVPGQQHRTARSQIPTMVLDGR
jgi:hypothetical protein